MADDEFHDAVEGDEFDFEPSLGRFHDNSGEFRVVSPEIFDRN